MCQFSLKVKNLNEIVINKISASCFSFLVMRFFDIYFVVKSSRISKAVSLFLFYYIFLQFFASGCTGGLRNRSTLKISYLHSCYLQMI